MKCQEFKELLSTYQDNLLSPNQQKEFTTHLNLCKECSELSEEVSNIKAILPELKREVPFFLKNRLYLIGEMTEDKPQKKNYGYVKWIAATIGVAVLFLNIFYFTNIFPIANKTLHSAVAGIESFVVEAEAFIGKIKESNLFVTYKKTKTISKVKSKNNNEGA